MKIVISSGHGKYIRGASDILDEVDEARKVVEEVATLMRGVGVSVTTFHDNTSHTQDENLHTIVAFHNSQPSHDFDVSVHFNAYDHTSKCMGTECWYYSQETLAARVADKIAAAGGLIDRGPKRSTSLYFLNNTHEPAILIEVAFVDSQCDADKYRANFAAICDGIAEAISGQEIGSQPPGGEFPPVQPPTSGEALFHTVGRCSWFGGPKDTGVSPSEGLAFIFGVSEAPQLFLPLQPAGTTGLARRLNPYTHFIACRWDYTVTSKDFLKSGRVALVRAPATGIALTAFPADWGPNADTGRIADLSSTLMGDLGITTDDEVEVTFPYEVGCSSAQRIARR